jgi:hypothetical protein
MDALLEVGVVSLADARFNGERTRFELDNGLDELHGVVDLEDGGEYAMVPNRKH